MAEVAELKARYLGYGSGECGSILIYMLCAQPVYPSVCARENGTRQKESKFGDWRLWPRVRDWRRATSASEAVRATLS